MKAIFFLSILIFGANTVGITQSVGVGTTTPNNSAVLDVQSNAKGMLIPRMTTAQRAAISSPATGLLVFDNTTGSFWFKSAGNWVELVDTANNVWKKNGADAYVGVTGNVGIGTNVPGYNLHINRPSPRIGLTDARDGSFSGYLEGNFLDMNINSSRVVLGGTPGNLTLQTNSGFVLAGNVGIGSSNPSVKLQVEGGTGASGTGGGYLQLGSTNSINVGFDNNEIQARNNGVASKLYMQTSGNDLQIGGANNIIFKDGYQVYRTRPLSSYADLLPIAYARVNSSGTVLSGTGNLSVSHTAAGEYRILLLGENNIYANSGLYTIILTANGPGVAVPKYTSADIQSDNAIWVRIAVPRVDYSNTTIDGQAVSYLATGVYADGSDTGFSIVIYKM